MTPTTTTTITRQQAEDAAHLLFKAATADMPHGVGCTIDENNAYFELSERLYLLVDFIYQNQK